MGENKYLLTNISSNVFIEFSHLRDLYDHLNEKIFFSNISSKGEDVRRYMKTLAKLNDTFPKKTRKGYRPRNGYIFDIMLPRGYDPGANYKALKKYAETLVEEVGEGNMLKWYATIRVLSPSRRARGGDARMLRIIIPSRIYYPENNLKVDGDEVITNYSVSPAKIRLNHFNTRAKGSTTLFKLKMLELKKIFLEVLNQVYKEVKHFFKKLSYKVLKHVPMLETYSYINETIEGKNYTALLKKRRVTILNILVSKLNEYIADLGDSIPNFEGFVTSWSNYIKEQKKRHLIEINTLESEILKQIKSFELATDMLRDI